MRILHAVANAATMPVQFSLVSDYVHPNNRSLANSILNSAAYVGIALSSLTILMIDKIGWRQSFNVMGIAGMILGVATLLFVKEPERGVFHPKKEKEQKKNEEEK